MRLDQPQRDNPESRVFDKVALSANASARRLIGTAADHLPYLCAAKRNWQ